MMPDVKGEVRSATTGERFDVALVERLLPQLAFIARNSIARRWQAKVAASDIVQDTFVEASRTLSEFSGSTIGEFNRWLRAILTNNILDARRKFVDVKMRAVEREELLDRLPPETLPATDASPSGVAQSNEFDRELHQAIQCLSLIDRRIVTLRFQQELTFPEIGRRLEMHEDTVRKRWGRILAALQHHLQKFDSRAISRRS